MLTGREMAVLKAVVELGLERDEPVGAQTIAGNNKLDLCAASIRNIMAGLENKGFLEQPHTSAGREPSDKGYEYYAKHLSPRQKLPRAVEEQIAGAVDDPSLPDPSARLDALSKTLSTVSRQVALAGFVSGGDIPIREYRFFSLGGGRTGAALVTVLGDLPRLGALPGFLAEASRLERLAVYFNDRFSAMTLVQARRLLCRELESGKESGPMAGEAYKLALALEEGMASQERGGVFVEGMAHLLHTLSDDRDIAALKAASKALSEKEKLSGLLARLARGDGQGVIIGTDAMLEGLAGYSVVSHPFSGPHGLEGAVGVIGRKRMNYGFARALVCCAADRLARSMSKAESWSV